LPIAASRLARTGVVYRCQVHRDSLTLRTGAIGAIPFWMAFFTKRPPAARWKARARAKLARSERLNCPRAGDEASARKWAALWLLAP
jgi:hypothetical protein